MHTSDHVASMNRLTPPFLQLDPMIGRSLLLIAIIVGFGAAGYTLIEGWSPWKSLFFTLVTLTTVGYDDYGLSPAGERFTAVLMIGGIATVSYTGSRLLQRAVNHAAHPERRTMQQIRNMNHHYVVCGLGRTGRRVVDRLLEEEAAIVAIDPDERAVEEMRARGVHAFEGDASIDDTLAKAGVDRACAIAAVTSSDAVNALICLTARALAPETILIARAEDSSSIRKLQRAGATNVVAPATYGGDGVAEYMLRPDVAHLLPGLHTEGAALDVAEIFISSESPHCGRTIGEICNDDPRLVFVAARGTDHLVTVHPGPDHALEDGEVVVIAGFPDAVRAMRATMRACKRAEAA